MGAKTTHGLNLMCEKHGKEMCFARTTEKEMCFAETHSLKKGLKKFGEKGHDAAHKEMKQLHDRVCFRPVNPNEMTQEE